MKGLLPVLAMAMGIALSSCYRISDEEHKARLDSDNDGVPFPEDCDPDDPSVAPGMVEECDGVDNDCDGVIDEDCSECPDGGSVLTFYLDADGDSFGDPAEEVQACEPPPDHVETATDCDDTDAAVYPGAPELCDGIDNDCDGEQEAGGSEWFADADGDGFGDPEESVLDCSQPSGFVDNAADCDDSNPTIPAATELAGNEVDEDCNGTIECFVDADGDGVGVPETVISSDLVCAAADFESLLDTDCDDSDPGVLEGQEWFLDGDGDGVGAGAAVFACTAPPQHVAASDDCNDSDGLVFPGAPELCDGLDNDCDGVPETEDPTWYGDADGDGFGDDADTVQDCVQPVGYVGFGGDCDDSDDLVFPGAGEVIGNDTDDDCDGLVECWPDDDLDGFGGAVPVVSADGDCEAADFEASESGDCDDADPARNPGALEVPGNEVDEDCDDAILCFVDADQDGVGSTETVLSEDFVCATADEESLVDTDCDDGDAANVTGSDWFLDADQDGFGDGPAVSACTAPALHVAADGDCDDGEVTVYPGAPELCDGLDNDCDGTAEPGALDWYADTDGDGFGDPNNAQSDCSQPSGYVSDATDCNDTNSSVFPGGTEVVGNNLDDDCDGDVECWSDLDQDGWGSSVVVVSADSDCETADSEASSNGDCNDSNPLVSPGETESAGNEVDEDCDDTILCFVDSDQDGFGVSATVTSPNLVCSTADGESLVDTDCDDTNASLNAGQDWYLDDDLDGFGDAATFACAAPPLHISQSGDCDDGNADAYPSAPDLCGDGIDLDCDTADCAGLCDPLSISTAFSTHARSSTQGGYPTVAGFESVLVAVDDNQSATALVSLVDSPLPPFSVHYEVRTDDPGAPDGGMTAFVLKDGAAYGTPPSDARGFLEDGTGYGVRTELLSPEGMDLIDGFGAPLDTWTSPDLYTNGAYVPVDVLVWPTRIQVFYDGVLQVEFDNGAPLDTTYRSWGFSAGAASQTSEYSVQNVCVQGG